MRNRNRPAYDQRHVECIHELFARHAGVRALFDVISDAIIASQDNRTNQSHQFLGPLIQGAVFIGLRIERKKSLDAEMPTIQKRPVHLSAITIKIVHQIEPFKIAYLSSECTTA